MSFLFTTLLTFTITYGVIQMFKQKRNRHINQASFELQKTVAQANYWNAPNGHFWNKFTVIGDGSTIVMCKYCEEIASTKKELYTPCNRNDLVINETIWRA